MSKRHMRSGTNPHRKLNMYCAACDDVGGDCVHPRVRLGSYTRPPAANRKTRRYAWCRKIVAQLRSRLKKRPELEKRPPRKRGGKITPKYL